MDIFQKTKTLMGHGQSSPVSQIKTGLNIFSPPQKTIVKNVFFPAQQFWFLAKTWNFPRFSLHLDDFYFYFLTKCVLFFPSSKLQRFSSFFNAKVRRTQRQPKNAFIWDKS